MNSEESKCRISVREAYESAVKYAKETYPEATEFLLEETELTEDENGWIITLSWYMEIPVPPSVPAVVKKALVPQLNGLTKQYKSFEIDARTGDVRSMKIRNI